MATAVDAELEAALATSAEANVLLILQVYRTGRNGSKAYVQLVGTDWTRDAYFWWTPVIPGSIVIAADTGWTGPADRDDALRIGGKDLPPGTGIISVIPPYRVKRWSRHHRRRAGD